MKVKLFTHTDLDGVSCALLAKLTFEAIDIVYCDYHDVDDSIQDFILSDNLLQFDRVFITDINVNEATAEMIEALDLSNKFQLLDHHSSADWLNKYEWALVNEYYSDITQTCGTSMLYDYIHNSNDLFYQLLASCNQKIIEQYIELVRRYDTWEWQTIFNDYEAKSLNDLFYIYGRDRFISKFMDKLRLTNVFDFSDNEKMILDLEQDKIQNYINKMEDTIAPFPIGKFKGGFLFAEQYISELGNALHQRNPFYDFIAIINLPSRKVSYRTIHNHIDLGKDIASHFGGGGRAKTAGSELSDSIMTRLMEAILQTSDSTN
ncbi:DHH family phosphoesterase [Virgibacillus salexigens]|uniref:Oligoribonuclease NrnB n=1 Tax=Virgibacillus massiliensis TaxID=1462526 RepID=A0A024QIW1_9BACI|nr:DHH family phosphoesterase [Virgibacillus massiliensis]CDQ41891.1 Oligoribonuclease NrnB [Virgibacillus massiliensis]